MGEGTRNHSPVHGGFSLSIIGHSVWPYTHKGVYFCLPIRDLAFAPSPTAGGLESGPRTCREKDPFRGRVLGTHHGSDTEVQDLQDRGELRGGEEEYLVLVHL